MRSRAATWASSNLYEVTTGKRSYVNKSQLERRRHLADLHETKSVVSDAMFPDV